MKQFYFVNLLLLLYFALLYFGLRVDIDRILRKKHSKTYIRKKKKGFWNYWGYRQIHSEHPMGSLYSINKIYLASLVTFAVMVLFTGYWAFMRIPVTCAAIAFTGIGTWCGMSASARRFQAEYGRKFVLYEKGSSWPKRPDSSILELLINLVPLLFIYVSNLSFAA